eukprot:260809-Amphidinium_carterae.1
MVSNLREIDNLSFQLQPALEREFKAPVAVPSGELLKLAPSLMPMDWLHEGCGVLGTRVPSAYRGGLTVR